ncbi:hypothetical protein [Kibdelosporangium phytohabitans]|uniref:Uncharacterized protein n=1 Tax=Kibdelosporangium phytohabitans TaxID=860235 RepID=A0A0N7F409_9PSEU|nr:hypothetical protein [Kibdelosporangium phytohabitans]ALG10119.1 hypothetical protein AOZ06_27340 [Kibdelosporangium phytohabitans]MBE1461104.1 hypothetical protein [Kibdelosporangium phytohabitans]
MRAEWVTISPFKIDAAPRAAGPARAWSTWNGWFAFLLVHGVVEGNPVQAIRRPKGSASRGGAGNTGILEGALDRDRLTAAGDFSDGRTATGNSAGATIDGAGSAEVCRAIPTNDGTIVNCELWMSDAALAPTGS